MPHVSVGNVPVAVITGTKLVELMLKDVEASREGTLVRPVSVLDCNGQTLSMRATDREFAAALSDADIIHADGQFIVWMSRLSRGPAIPERIATTDFIHHAARVAAAQEQRFFLLGGTEDINRRCAEELVRLYPGLQIAGRRNGYFTAEEEGEVCAEINGSDADVVWVGLGKPKEQLFAARHHADLRCAWIVTCGGCFHFIVGDYARAPVWMRKAGLEWLHRMMTGPRYLIGRYARTIPHAFWLVLRHDMLKRPASGGRPEN